MARQLPGSPQVSVGTLVEWVGLAVRAYLGAEGTTRLLGQGGAALQEGRAAAWVLCSAFLTAGRVPHSAPVGRGPGPAGWLSVDPSQARTRGTPWPGRPPAARCREGSQQGAGRAAHSPRAPRARSGRGAVSGSPAWAPKGAAALRGFWPLGGVGVALGSGSSWRTAECHRALGHPSAGLSTRRHPCAGERCPEAARWLRLRWAYKSWRRPGRWKKIGLLFKNQKQKASLEGFRNEIQRPLSCPGH